MKQSLSRRYQSGDPRLPGRLGGGREALGAADDAGSTEVCSLKKRNSFWLPSYYRSVYRAGGNEHLQPPRHQRWRRIEDHTLAELGALHARHMNKSRMSAAQTMRQQSLPRSLDVFRGRPPLRGNDIHIYMHLSPEQVCSHPITVESWRIPTFSFSWHAIPVGILRRDGITRRTLRITGSSSLPRCRR